MTGLLSDKTARNSALSLPMNLLPTLARNVPGLGDLGGAVSLRQLLSHTSGLADICGAEDLSTPVLRRYVVDHGCRERLISRPGMGFSYSNPGYALAVLLGNRVHQQRQHRPGAAAGSAGRACRGERPGESAPGSPGAPGARRRCRRFRGRRGAGPRSVPPAGCAGVYANSGRGVHGDSGRQRVRSTVPRRRELRAVDLPRGPHLPGARSRLGLPGPRCRMESHRSGPSH